MTKTDENRVHYLLDCCDENGYLSIDAADMALILEYQRELGRAEGRSELHEILQDIVYAQSMKDEMSEVAIEAIEKQIPKKPTNKPTAVKVVVGYTDVQAVLICYIGQMNPRITAQKTNTALVVVSELIGGEGEQA